MLPLLTVTTLLVYLQPRPQQLVAQRVTAQRGQYLVLLSARGTSGLAAVTWPTQCTTDSQNTTSPQTVTVELVNQSNPSFKVITWSLLWHKIWWLKTHLFTADFTIYIRIYAFYILVCITILSLPLLFLSGQPARVLSDTISKNLKNVSKKIEQPDLDPLGRPRTQMDDSPFFQYGAGDDEPVVGSKRTHNVLSHHGVRITGHSYTVWQLFNNSLCSVNTTLVFE